MEQIEWTTGNVDAAAVATAVDIGDSSCDKTGVCSSNVYCCIYDKMPIHSDPANVINAEK